MAIVDKLKQVSIFSELKQHDFRRIAKRARIRNYKAGDVIVKEGTGAAGCFIISSGRVEVVRDVDSPDTAVLARLGPGEIFGEMAIIDTQFRSATVRALEDTECVAIWRVDFRAELRTHPEITIRLLSVVVRRLQDVEARSA